MDTEDDTGSRRLCPTRALPAWLQETALQGQPAVPKPPKTTDEGDELKFLGSGCIVTDMERKDFMYKIVMERRKMLHVLCAFQLESKSGVASLNAHCIRCIFDMF